MTWTDRHRDLTAGVLLLLLGGATLLVLTSFPFGQPPMGDPALFPRIIAAGLIVAGVAVVLVGLAGRRHPAGAEHGVPDRGASRESAAKDVLDEAPAGRDRRVVVLAAAIALYCLTAFSVGFLTMTALFVVAVGLLLGQSRSSRGLIALAVSAVVLALVYYFAFFQLLGVRLPHTPLP